MRVEIYTDGGAESLQQVATLRKVAERFPALEIVEFPADGPEAQEAGIILPPGLVIDGIVLSIGRALSAGRLRRFLERHQVQE